MIEIHHSIKTRILFVTGSIIVLIMMLISLAILFQWRNILIDKQITNAESVADAFVVPALDAIIYAEQRELLKDDLLETYIENFIQRVKNIEYIMIYDDNNTLIASKNRTGTNDFNLGIDSNIVTNNFRNIIHNSEGYGWLLDTYVPLSIASKNWGIAKIGFNANPIREEVEDIFFFLFGLTILLSIVTLTVLYFLINRITFSLHSLVQQIDKVDFNNIETLKLKRSKDEIGFLIHTFDELLKRLQKSREQLSFAQKQVYQSEKLASIGRLASGVAHEINNPLNGIKNCIYAIQKEPDNKEQTYEYLELANEGIFYIENVIKKLLGFARQQPQISNALNINDLAINVYKLLEYKLKQKNAKVEFNLYEDITTVKADQQLIQEVIMNLLINAYDAIAMNGNILISSGVNSDRYIFLSIQDNGTGISEKDLNKIFDPFYTTKDPGEGTGLGLWVSMEIIENHNGSITVKSIPNKETIFTILLPTEVTDENNVS